jgi:hypothetical protein
MTDSFPYEQRDPNRLRAPQESGGSPLRRPWAASVVSAQDVRLPSNVEGPLVSWTLVGAVGLLVIVRCVGSLVFPIYDDAYITFRYARNVAAGHGFAFNPGPPLLGTTSPLFAVMASFLHLVRLPIEASIVGLNTVCDVLSLVITWIGVGSRNTQLEGILFALFFASSPIATRIAVGGMEVNVFLLLSTLSILLYHKDRRTLAIGVTAVSVFLRPEGVALVGLLLLLDWSDRGLASGTQLGVVAVLIIVPVLALVGWHFGHIVPQSVLAKARHLNSSPFPVVREFLFADPSTAILLLPAVWGAATVANINQFSRTVGVWGVVYLLAYLIMRPHVWSWYGEPVHYAEFVLAAVGCGDFIRRVPTLRAWLTEGRLLRGGGVAIVAVWIAILWVRGASAVTTSVYRPLEAWCREHISAQDTIVASDVGAIGYFSGARIYDVSGLVWADALTYKSVADVIEAIRPDYLFLAATVDQMRPMTHANVAQLYQPVRTFSTTEQYDLLRSAGFADEWRPEYVLFKRVDAAAANSQHRGTGP